MKTTVARFFRFAVLATGLAVVAAGCSREIRGNDTTTQENATNSDSIRGGSKTTDEATARKENSTGPKGAPVASESSSGATTTSTSTTR